MTGGHDRQPLERDQAREWQRAVFEAIDEQQLDRYLAEHFAFSLEAIVRRAAEYVALQRHQLHRRRALVPHQRGLQFLVGVRQGGVQYTFDLGAGVPRTADADCADGDNDSQKHACRFIHE
ncbi:hypothetical protein D9M71_822080 [compost metagenome]